MRGTCRAVGAGILVCWMASIPTATISAVIPEFLPDRAVPLPEAMTGMTSVMDFDVLADGRIAVLDFDSRSVAILGRDGSLEVVLAPLSEVPTVEGRFSRILALPDGGLVLADSNGNRFFFYDSQLQLVSIIPFGLEVHSLNALIRHPSGDLYVTGYSPDNNKILHRFDFRGWHVASYVEALEAGELERALDSAALDVDPDDGTLWLSRFARYEILHLMPDGEVLNRMGRDVPGFKSPKPQREGKFYRFSDQGGSSHIAVAGNVVVNSFVMNDGRRFADAFGKDGSAVELEMQPTRSVAFSRRAGSGDFIRYVNGGLQVLRGQR